MKWQDKQWPSNRIALFKNKTKLLGNKTYFSFHFPVLSCCFRMLSFHYFALIRTDPISLSYAALGERLPLSSWLHWTLICCHATLQHVNSNSHTFISKMNIICHLDFKWKLQLVKASRKTVWSDSSHAHSLYVLNACQFYIAPFLPCSYQNS